MALKALLLSLLLGVVSATTERPIIAIFAQPTTSSYCPNGESCQYIAASYIKFVESMGGRVVPLGYNASDDTVKETLNSVNGMLIPGGSAGISDSAITAINYVKEMNDAGTHFPMWCTCMGFEWLIQAFGGTLESGYDSENVSLPLNFTSYAPTSRMFGSLKKSLYYTMAGPNTTAFNNHGMGYSPSQFEDVDELKEMFNVLSTSRDLNDRLFVSAVEAKDYPFYGVQFHPEKIIWEHGETTTGAPYENIPHTQDGMDTTLHFAEVLMKEARQNDNRYADASTEQASLIWRYPIFYTNPEFVQEYIYDF